MGIKASSAIGSMIIVVILITIFICWFEHIDPILDDILDITTFW